MKLIWLLSLPAIVIVILLYLFTTGELKNTQSNQIIERADLVICRYENWWRKEKWVIPVDSVSRNYIVDIQWNVYDKSSCEVLSKCNRIENYRSPSDEFETWDIIWFTCTSNIIFPEKV